MTASRFPPVAIPEVPFAAALQAICLAQPGAWEDYPWGSVVFKVGPKMFATMGEIDGVARVTVKATPADAAVLVTRPGIAPAHYVGRFGWVTMAVAGEDDFALAGELIGASYVLVAPKRRRRRLT